MEGAEPSSSSADGETLATAFLFDSFFFAPISAKEKAAKMRGRRCGDAGEAMRGNFLEKVPSRSFKNF